MTLQQVYKQLQATVRSPLTHHATARRGGLPPLLTAQQYQPNLARALQPPPG